MLLHLALVVLVFVLLQWYGVTELLRGNLNLIILTLLTLTRMPEMPATEKQWLSVLCHKSTLQKILFSLL